MRDTGMERPACALYRLIALHRLPVACSCLGLLWMTLGCSQETCTPADNPPTNLVCGEPLWDMGTVDGRREYSHTFTLTNVGDNKIRMGDVHSTCGCLATKPKGAEIGPGESLEVPVTLAVTVAAPRIDQAILVEVAPPHKQVVELRIVGRVRVDASLALSQRELDFGTMEHGDIRTSSAFLSRLDGSDVEFRRLASTGACIVVTGENRASNVPPGGVRLTFELDSTTLPLGYFASKIVIQTSATGSHAQLEVPVRARIIARRTGLVESLFVGAIAPGEVKTFPLLPGSQAQSGVEVIGCLYSGPDSLAIVHHGSSPGSDVIRVTRSERASTVRLLRGELTVTTHHPDSVVRIPITALLK